MLLKHLYKKTAVLTLIVVLLIVITACSEASQGGRTKEPSGTPDALPGAEVDKGEGNSGDDSDSETESERILKEYQNQYGVIDAPIEDFELEDLEGNKVRLSDFKGKIVFLNFWATWCPPCRDEMPHMQAFYEKYRDEDVVVLAVNSNQVENRGASNSKKAEEKVRGFIEKEGYTFTVLLDSDDSVWAIYQQRGIPANYMIDKEGTIKYLKPGAFLSLKEMEDFASALKVSTSEQTP